MTICFLLSFAPDEASLDGFTGDATTLVDVADFVSDRDIDDFFACDEQP